MIFHNFRGSHGTVLDSIVQYGVLFDADASEVECGDEPHGGKVNDPGCFAEVESAFRPQKMSVGHLGVCMTPEAGMARWEAFNKQKMKANTK